MFQKNKKEEEKKNPVTREYSLWSNIRFIFGNMFHYQKALIWLVPMPILIHPVTAYLWTFVSKFVIELITEGGTWQELVPLISGFFVIMMVALCLNTFYWSNTWYRYISVRMSLMIRLNRKVMSVPFEHLENSDVMDAFQKAQNAAGGNMDGVEGMMRSGTSFINNLAVVIVGILIMGTLNPWIILLILVTGFLSFVGYDWANAYSKKTVWDVLSGWWRKNNYMNHITTDFTAAKDIRMFSLSNWLMEKRKELDEYRYQMQIKNEKIWLVSALIGNISWAGSQLGVYGFIIYAVVKGQISVADAFLYVSTAGTFYEHITSVLRNYAELRQKSRQVCDFRSFLDFEEEEQAGSLKPVPNCKHYEFVFENVSFKYPKAEKYALKNLNLKLEAGERLAVVGLNGAGKSTFIKLLLRLYEPTEGRILLNGTDVREYDINSYYNLFAPVFQEVYQFAFPLAENISMNTPENTDEAKATECLEKAGLTEKIRELPKGIHTQMLKIIEDDGVDFSGGEKQKLAFGACLV